MIGTFFEVIYTLCCFHCSKCNDFQTSKSTSQRWRLAPTRREQEKWDKATKAATGGSVCHGPCFYKLIALNFYSFAQNSPLDYRNY